MQKKTKSSKKKSPKKHHDKKESAKSSSEKIKHHKHHTKKEKKEFKPGKLAVICALAIIIIIVLVVIHTTSTNKGSNNGVAASVNGVDILDSEINMETKLFAIIYQQEIPKSNILTQAIERELLSQEAKKQGITASQTIIDREIEGILQNSGISMTELNDKIEKQEISREYLEKIYEGQILAIRLINKTVLLDIEVSEDEIEQLKQFQPDLNNEDIKFVLRMSKEQGKIQEYIDSLKEKGKVKIYNTFQQTSEPSGYETKEGVLAGSFTKTENNVCMEDGKPIIRLFSTTSCPHCSWIKESFDEVAREYQEKGQIVAYHWELDNGDNTLTTVKESNIPEKELAVYKEFSPQGYVPTFVFGCQYYRIGNGHESASDGKELEKEEFKKIINELIS